MWGHMSTTDLPGSSLLANRYRLVERLGAGGMSVVWRGFDEVLGRQVAVKVLPPSTSADPSFRRRLRAEAQAAARLSHPNITNVYDYGEATTVDGEPVPYVVMELVDGESLAAVLARVRRLPWPAAVRICSEVSAALAAAHSRGIVHRDVTPANVMLTSSGAKVVDFGISALIGENDIDPDGSLLGTPAYLAPERLEGGQVSPATDVYAVGLLIYRTLIGQLPWDVGTTTALLRAHQYTEPEPLPPVEGLPAAVSALVERCLEKRPDDRPSSADLAHVLAGIAAGSPAGPRLCAGLGGERRGHHDPAVAAHVHRRHRPDPARARPGRRLHAGTGRPGRRRGPRLRRGTGRSRRGGRGDGGGVRERAGLTRLRAWPCRCRCPTSKRRWPASRSATPGCRTRRRPATTAGRDRRPAATIASVRRRWPPACRSKVRPRASGDPGAGGLRPAFSARATSRCRPLRASVAVAARRRTRTHPGRPDPPPGGPRRFNRRRLLVVAGAVAVLGLATYGWALGAVPDGKDKADPAPTVLAGNGKCVVSYAVYSDDGQRFKATVTVANRDYRAIKNWNLWFIMQGDQVLSGAAGKVSLDQQGTAVTVKGSELLSPQKSKTMTINGRYTTSNKAPMVFQLGNENCATYVSEKPGDPSKPVVRLPNGDIGLGAPVKDNPVPGISVGPDGVVTPTSIAPGSSPTGQCVRHRPVRAVRRRPSCSTAS